MLSLQMSEAALRSDSLYIIIIIIIVIVIVIIIIIIVIVLCVYNIIILCACAAVYRWPSGSNRCRWHPADRRVEEEKNIHTHTRARARSYKSRVLTKCDCFLHEPD